MWTRYCYKNKAEEYFIPTPNEGWSFLQKNEHLPILKISKDISSPFVEKITSNICCHSLNVISKTKIEPLCTYCENGIVCMLKKRDFNIKEFLPIKNERLKWSRTKLNALKNTMEIPFNLLFEKPLEPLQNTRFEILASDDVKNLVFDVERIKHNITTLRLIPDLRKALFFHQSLAVYAKNENEVWDELPFSLLKKLETLELECSKYSSKEFDTLGRANEL